MRTKNEIKQAVAILKHKADCLSMVMAEVLEEKMSEQQVFRKYVVNVNQAEADRDESVFFAARDAARYLAGHLQLSDLLPELEEAGLAQTRPALPTDEKADPDKITVSRRTLINLMQRVNRLEKALGIRKATMKINRKPVTQDVEDQLISQAEACRYVGCGKSTIKRWADKGLLTGYKEGTRVYFSKRELDRSPVVKEHRICKGEDTAHE